MRNKSVTKNLSLLCIGPNAGPVKLQKAKDNQATILNPDQLNRMFETGESPNSDYD
jgi:BRCT domain type II-containing protein